MSSKEVIEALTICSAEDNRSCSGCPLKARKTAYCVKVLLKESLKLINNIESVTEEEKKPTTYTKTRQLLDLNGNAIDYETDVFLCANCGEYICDVDEPMFYNYCSNCGQKLEWEQVND